MDEIKYPIITRDKTPHWEEVGGRRIWVQEVVWRDWGPKQGVNVSYIVAPENDDPEANARELDRVLQSIGYRLRGHGSTLPPGMTRRPGPPEESA